MEIFSFAQNQEDVTLQRMLFGVKEGYYVDVGAGDPVINSITKVFYDQGWHGINFEPAPRPFKKLQIARPRDTNLGALVGSAIADEATLYLVESWDEISTTDPTQAEQWIREGRPIVEHRTRCTTLQEIMQRNGPSLVHFLKVDVEGSEYEVLRGADFATFRPWIVLFEVVAPETSDFRIHLCREILLAHGYEFAYFDGLNEFFVATERSEEISGNLRRADDLIVEVTYQLELIRAEQYRDIAQLVGSGETSAYECFERVWVLLQDRIRFENEAVHLRALLMDQPHLDDHQEGTTSG